MIIVRTAWTRRGFRCFEDCVNKHLQCGHGLKEICMDTGLFGLRWILVAVLECHHQPKGAA